ncbi:MAG: hypothetical protein AAF989_01105 [Planctomycetota bacterium]
MNTTNTAATEGDEQSESDFFRCPVQEDQGDALVHVGRRKLQVTVQETSIDGFTILVSPSLSKHLKVGKPWVLDFDGTRFEVHAQWFFHAPDGHVQVGMRRLRDLTPAPTIKTSWWPSAKNSGRADSSDSSALAFAGFVMFLCIALALPGFGDRLGTAEPLGNAVKTAFNGLSEFLGSWI